MRNTLTVRLLTLLALLFWGCNQSAAEAGHELRAASALFGRFETVFYAKGSIVSNSGLHGPVAKDADELRLPFFELQEALKSLGGDTSREVMTNSEGVFVGAKSFRSPSGLGPVRSERCYIMILKGGEIDLYKRFPQSPAGSVAGASIWSWSAKLGEFGEDDPRPSSFYATQIAGSYLLLSNNLEDLQATAKGLIWSENPETILTGIRDWEMVRQHEVWGYRRYRHTGVVDAEAAGMSWVTPGAEALVFFVDFEEKISVMRLSSSGRNEDAAAKMNATAKLPPLKPEGGGVWETRIPLTGDEGSFERLANVMDCFGFGVYV